VCLLTGVPAPAFQQSDTTKSVEAPAKEPEAPAPDEATEERVTLNLLGQTDVGAGESRRNENIQFNLVDNNALKELNVRLGTTATIISEFKPERGYFGAEFGVPPLMELPVTGMGRTGWHGNFFYGHQNSAFSARSFFQVGAVRPAREHTYGFSTGFDIWKGGYLFLQGRQDRLRGSVNGNVLVPKPDERTPLTTDPDTRAIVERYLAGYPNQLPNRTDINPRALNTNAPQTIDNNDGAIRIDQDVSTKDRLFLRYHFISQSVDAFQLVAGQNPNTDTRSHRARLTWNRTWSANTITDVALGFDRVGSLLLPDATSVGPLVSTAGLTALGPGGNIPIDRAHNRYEGEVRVQSVRGRHYLQAGFGFLRSQFNGIETDAHRGFFSFSNDFGRGGIENLRRGTPSVHIISIGNVRRGFRRWKLRAYLSDDWRVTRNLTIQIGIRYAPVTRPYEVNNLNQIPYGCNCRNFAPRFGIAYRLPAKWGVLRAAYGLHYGDIFPVTYSQVRFSPPGSEKLTINAPDLVDPLEGIDSGESDARGNRYRLDPELTTPYSHQYNFSWEPDFSSDWRLQFGYVGSRSHKLLIMWYRNRAQPVEGIPQTTKTINQRRADNSIAEIRWVLNGSRGYFDALRVSLIAPRVGGFAIDTSYWFSKAMDLGASYTNTAYDSDSRLSRSQWEFETHKDRRALSDFDQTHSFLARVSWQSPEGHWRGWRNYALGGWVVSAVTLLKTGTPFAVTTFDGPGFGNVDGNGGDRPNLLDTSILGRSFPDPDTSRERLPVGAFSLMAPTDHGGNISYNVFRKGGIHNLNASIAKTWSLTAETRFTLRAESINLLNTPQFAAPGNRLGNPEFGQITNTLNDGRTFRLHAQFGW